MESKIKTIESDKCTNTYNPSLASLDDLTSLFDN